MMVEPLSKIWVNYQNKPILTSQYMIKAAIVAAFNAVPGTGLEPVWRKPHAPQTCVSTSSTIPA